MSYQFKCILEMDFLIRYFEKNIYSAKIQFDNYMLIPLNFFMKYTPKKHLNLTNHVLIFYTIE